MTTREVKTVDEALERFSGRTMVPAAEVCDVLLDLREYVHALETSLAYSEPAAS